MEELSISRLRVLLTPASSRRAKLVEPLRAVGTDLRVVPARARGRLGLLRNMATAFSAAAFTSADVVLADEAVTFVATAAWRGARLRGRPFILRARGDWFQEAEDKASRGEMGAAGSPRAHRLFRRCFESADGIIPVSEALGEILRARMDLDPERMIAIPPPTDTERFHPADEAERSRIKTELGYECAHLLPVVTGFQFAQKVAGVERFLPLLRALVDAREDTTVVIAGDGPLHAEFLERNRELLDHPHLLTPGFVKGVERLYRCASFVPFFSLLDACPNVLPEAWASGRAVVVNDYAPLTENLREGETGLVLREPDDVAGCLETMTHLLDDEPLRESMGEAGRRVAEEQFAPAAIGAWLSDAITTLAGLDKSRGDR